MAPYTHILAIDDEPGILRFLQYNLQLANYTVQTAAYGTEGLKSALETAPDLVLLDLGLPDLDGLEVLRQLRLQSDTPVIIITARDDEESMVAGLKLGADDYVIKPFSVKELLARVEAVLRRSPERPQQPTNLPVPGGFLDLGHGELLFEDGTRCPLAEKEAELLRYLIQNQGRVLSRDELLARVWHLNPDAVETRTVDMHIARLREKLRDDPEHPRMIVTVRGRGYTFEVAG